MGYLPTLGCFLGQMLVNIPYMEHTASVSSPAAHSSHWKIGWDSANHWIIPALNIFFSLVKDCFMYPDISLVFTNSLPLEHCHRNSWFTMIYPTWWFSLLFLTFIGGYITGFLLNQGMKPKSSSACWMPMPVARQLTSAFGGSWCQGLIASGKHTKSYGKWWFIVDLPINSMVIFHSYDSLPLW